MPPSTSAERGPLSHAQQHTWTQHQLSTGTSAHNLPVALRLRGSLEVSTLRAAVTALVVRHDVLRTRFGVSPDGPYQAVGPTSSVHLPVDDLSGVAPAQRENALASALIREARLPFDIGGGQMLRARLIRLAPEEHVLGLTTHRLCLDNASVGLLIDELVALYRRGAAVPGVHSGHEFTYLDFAAADRRTRSGAGLRPHLRYWEQTLTDVAPLELPTDRQRPRRASGAGSTVSHRVPAHVLSGGHLADDAATVVLTGVVALLSWYSGQDDFVIGTVRSGRTSAGQSSRLGPFAELTPLHADLSGDPEFGEAVRRCRESLRAAHEHAEAPIDEVVHRLHAYHRPLFRVAVNAGQHAAPPQVDRAGIVVDRLDVDLGHARMDLHVDVNTVGDDVVVVIEYDTDLFDRSRIDRMLRHLEVLLTAGAADPSTRLSRLPVLTDAELLDTLTTWQGLAVGYRREPIHQQIREHAVRTPDAVAVRLDDVSLTYGELNRRAELLARRLRGEGLGREDIVGIFLERGLDAIVAMLGILTAGGAFAILDPSYPTRRLEFMLHDTNAAIVLTRSGLLPRLPTGAGRTLICMDTDWAELEGQPTNTPLAEWADEHSLAYVLYTSGSTGRPKGALIEHGSLSNFVMWPVWLFDLGPGDRMLQHMALVFDFSEGEIFTGLTCGATLVLLPERVRTSPEALGNLIADEKITCVFGPPAVLSKVDLGACPDLRYVVVGGDICTGDLVTRWNTPGRRFVNGYGPTEATVGCTAFECDHRTWTAQPPIGRAMPNRFAYILDGEQRPRPVGVPGELYVGGVGLARGYLNEPDLTDQRFVPNPYRPGERMYRTGDLCEWTEDGQLHFLGRIDTQVKVNGLRVELEEIEVALAGHPDVRHAAVTPYEDAWGAKRLVAHVVMDTESVDATALRTYLAELLPNYLVPAQFIPIATLPLTTVGKIDRAALRSRHDRAADTPAFRPPRTPLELQIATMLAEALGQQRVGVDDDFFELGGTTLSLVLFTTNLNQSLAVELTPHDVHDAPTLSGITALVTQYRAAAEGRRTLALLAQVEQMSNDEISVGRVQPQGSA